MDDERAEQAAPIPRDRPERVKEAKRRMDEQLWTELRAEAAYQRCYVHFLRNALDYVPRDEPDDFRHRMLANIAAFAFTVALTAIGIWLAMSIADLRRTQDCVLMGRRDCVRISTPSI